MTPPAGVRSLFLACLDRTQPQFRGVRRALQEIGSSEGCCARDWDGAALALRRRRVLRQVVVAGHGREDQAGFAAGAPGTRGFTPDGIALPATCRLYLVGCFQGHPGLRGAWARGAGLPEQNVHGCGGETESALSTCLLLHLLEDGAEALERWFPAWLRANDRLRPHFPRIRGSYADNDGDPLRTLAQLQDLRSDRDLSDFLAVIERHPEYLRDLGRPRG